MDKKSKEALIKRYKKARLAARQRSSSDSSSSDSDSSYSSCSGSDRNHRKKKARRSSSSGEERRKREKRELCQKKLEAKRNHLKRKLKEAKLKKRAAVAAAVLSGHSHRSLSPNTQAKLKKLAERKHLRAQSKERREREREKHRAAAAAAAASREREHHRRSHSPTTKVRIHQDVKRQKSPPRMHQMLSREKIIIQARTRSHTPSAERERVRHEQKIRHEDLALVKERERRERERERAEREAARDKERAEALARCQERQRERERIAREKLRREEEDKKYAGSVGERGERLLARTGERELPVGPSRAYGSRERSMDSERSRHIPKREIDVAYEREREYMEVDRRGLLDREDIRREREREYMSGRRRDISPGADPYAPRIRDPRDIYEGERERAYPRPYIEDVRHPREREAAGWLGHDIREPRGFREMDHDALRYAEEREREMLMRERSLAARGEWKTNWAEGVGGRGGGERKWDDGTHGARGAFVGPKRTAVTAIPKLRDQRTNSEPDWDAGETADKAVAGKVQDKARETPVVPSRESWVEHDPRELVKPVPRPPIEHIDRRWPGEWGRESDDAGGRVIGGDSGMLPMHHHQRSERGGRGGFRHGYRGPPPLMNLPVPGPGIYGTVPRFPNKRNMTYTNPNLIKKQQALASVVAAAKAAAQSTATTTNPGILGQVTSKATTTTTTTEEESKEKPEAGEILPEHEENENSVEPGEIEAKTETPPPAAAKTTPTIDEAKASGELSEISDSEDDILNKAERKSKSDQEDAAAPDETAAKQKAETDVPPPPTEKSHEEPIEAELERSNNNDDDEMLDFEEISDGELEEEARHKGGVGDALGVDWASLIAETKIQAENAAQPSVEQPTTAKQKWQPHRVILDIGVSFRMAGEDYAKKLLANAEEQLQNEVKQVVKTEIKEEVQTPEDDDSQATTATIGADIEQNSTSSDNDKKLIIKTEETETATETEIKTEEGTDNKDNKDNDKNNDDDDGRLRPLACMQVAERKRLLEQRQLFTNACGPNSRALSARQDMTLRRQLCGLPAEEPKLPSPIPAVQTKLKTIALDAFKQTMEVK